MAMVTNQAIQAVGYTRVSTEKQKSQGDLTRQEDKLRERCLDHGIELLSIHGDVASGAGVHMAKRPGLRDAIKEAQARQVTIVVTDITRITREPEKFLQVVDVLKRHKIPFLSLNDPDSAHAFEMLRRVETGKAQLQRTRDGTQRALATMKDAGVVLGSPGDKRAAAAASAWARKRRAAEIVEQITDVLAENPVHEKLRLNDLADLLNGRGIATGWRRDWTASALRAPRRHAVMELKRRKILQAEIDAENEESFRHVDDPAASPEVDAAIKTLNQRRASQLKLSQVEPVADADDLAMKANPNYGRFE